MFTPLLLTASLAGAKTLGPERTADVLRRIGSLHQRTPLRGRRLAPRRIAERVERGYRYLPLPIECLEQALANWYLMNLKGHPASLRIGMRLTPLSGHAWVEAEGTIYGGIPGIEDYQVVGTIDPWP